MYNFDFSFTIQVINNAIDIQNEYLSKKGTKFLTRLYTLISHHFL